MRAPAASRPSRPRAAPGSASPVACASLLTAALAAGCAATSEAPCASDTACPGAQSCDLGACVDPMRARVPDLRARRLALLPRDDATVVSSTCCTTAAFGGHDTLVVGGAASGGAYRSYLAFDLSEVEGEQIGGAFLRLTASPRWCRGDRPLEVLVHAAGRSWSQRSLTWLGQPGAAGSPFGHALLRPDDASSTTIDVTDLVVGWAEGSIPNTGMVLRARREARDGRIAWHSAEALDARTRPRLEVHIR